MNPDGSSGSISWSSLNCSSKNVSLCTLFSRFFYELYSNMLGGARDILTRDKSMLAKIGNFFGGDWWVLIVTSSLLYRSSF